MNGHMFNAGNSDCEQKSGVTRLVNIMFGQSDHALLASDPSMQLES
jgi:hypothetical protein